MGTSSPPKRGVQPPPIFSPRLLRPNGFRWMHLDTAWYRGRPRPRRHCVRWGPSSPLKVHSPPPILARVRCCRTAVWIMMPLSIEVGLGSGDFVLDGDPAPPPKKRGHTTPIFGPTLLWPNNWMDQDATWYGGRPQPRRYCVRWGPSSPSQKRRAQPLYMADTRSIERISCF